MCSRYFIGWTIITAKTKQNKRTNKKKEIEINKENARLNDRKAAIKIKEDLNALIFTLSETV